MNQLAVEFAAEGFVDVNLKLAGKSMQVVAKMIILCLPVTVAQVDLLNLTGIFSGLNILLPLAGNVRCFSAALRSLR